MGLTLDRGRYYIVLNVPNYLFGKVLGRSGQPVRQVRQALKTADLTVAKRRAFEIAELKRAEWALLECGEDNRAYEKYEAAKKVAEGHGFMYMPMSEILELPIEEIIARAKVVGPADNPAPRPVVEALFGVVPSALPTRCKTLK